MDWAFLSRGDSMARRILLGLLVLVAGVARGDSPLKTTPSIPWDVKAIQSASVPPTWGKIEKGVREVYFPGEPYKGKPTRVFAYYGKPEGDGPFPAMVLVHGGGGKAFPDWVRHWTKRGYCAIAMDLAGHGPIGRLEDGAPDQADDTKFIDFSPENPRDMWTYHAVADVIRAHNLIRSQKEVDPNRIGVTGISWGGYLTCIVAGTDDRFRVAVPVYGCGFLQEDSAWKGSRFDKMTPEHRGRWVKTFDPSQHVGRTGCPILFLNGTNDFAYPMGSYKKTFDLVQSPKTMSMRVRLPHGHIWTFGEVDAFVDAVLKGGKPLAKVGELTIQGDKASTIVSPSTGLREARFNFAKAEGPWQTREWKTVPAKIVIVEGKDNQKTIEARLPKERPIAFYLSVVDDRGLEVSTTHMVLER